MQNPKSVVIVEDSEPTRIRLSNVVEKTSGLNLVASVSSVSMGKSCLDSMEPDVLLTDLELPDGSGIELIKLASLHKRTESIVITVLGDEKSVVGALQAGASGYILKDSEPADIGDTILKTCEGGSTISPAVARYLLKQFSSPATRHTDEITQTDTPATLGNDASAAEPGLTKREHEVLRLIAKGFTYQEAATALSVSIHTITTHLKHIYRKLAVNSRGEAVYQATQIGLI